MATYVVVFELQQRVSVSIGALGTFSLQSGYYIYVGQARRGVWQRLARHFRQEKRLWWHVDYLGQVAAPLECWADETAQSAECLWAGVLASFPAARRLVPRFGASDCRCSGHLVYMPQRPEAKRFRAGLQKLGAGDGSLVVRQSA